MALAVAVPTGAMAQEITGSDGNATDLSGSAAIISGAVGGQFGAIDTDGGGNNPASITLTLSETISITDSAGGNAEASTVTGEFVIATGEIGTLIFAEADDDTNRINGNAAVLTISGNLAGSADGLIRGGGLTLTVRDGVDQDGSAFNVLGSTNMDGIIVGAGDGVGGAGDGGNIEATFGDGDDTFDATGIAVIGGNGDGANAGGDATVTIAADGGAEVITIGADGITVNAGDAGGTGLGGTSTLEIADSATVAGDVDVTGGDGSGTANSGNGGVATVDFSDGIAGSSVIIDGALNISTGADTDVGTSEAGTAIARFASQTVTVTGGIVLDEAEVSVAPDGDVGTAGLVLDGIAAQIVNGAITSATGGTGLVRVENSVMVTFADTIGADGASIRGIELAGSSAAVFQDNVFADNLDFEGPATATFEGATSVLGETSTSGAGEAVVVGDGTTAATLTIAGNAAHTAGTTINNLSTLVIDDADNGGVTVTGVVNGDGGTDTTLQTIDTSGDGHTVTFSAAVGSVEPISLIDLDTATTFDMAVSGGDFDIDGNTTATGNLAATGDVDVADPFTLTLNGTTNAIAGDITGEGTLAIGDNVTDVLNIGADGEMSTVSIANLIGGTGPGDINIVDGAMVTITSTIGAGTAIGDFTSEGTGTVLTINSGTGASGETAITGNGTLTLDEGTIVLGSNIGTGDTVFAVNTLAAGATGATAVQLAANFTEGSISFVDTAAPQDFSDGGADDGLVDAFDAQDTALTDFTVQAGTDTSILEITATALSASETADDLGISEEDAIALRRALESTIETDDEEGFNALNTVLNADDDGVSAALAAETVGTQEDTLGGASRTAFEVLGEQTGFITARLDRSRSQSGFSGGDLPGQYSPQVAVAAAPAPSSMGGVWGQAFGGVANADGDGNAAGWDAAYGGMMIGIDGMVSEDFTIGAFGSYTFSTVDGDGAGDSEIEANTFGFGVYAGYAGDGFYLDGFAAYAASQNDLSRTAIVNNVSTDISADYDASQFSIGLAGGVPIEMSSNVFITPNASLTYNHYDADRYTETGTNFTQTVNPDSVSNLTGTIGARIHAVYENFDNDGTVFIPEFRVALIGDLIDDDATASAAFAGSAAYQVTGTNTDDIGALIGFGLGLDNPDWSAGISYDADLRGDYMSHTGRAEFRWKF